MNIGKLLAGIFSLPGNLLDCLARRKVNNLDLYDQCRNSWRKLTDIGKVLEKQGLRGTDLERLKTIAIRLYSYGLAELRENAEEIKLTEKGLRHRYKLHQLDTTFWDGPARMG